jgi:hypothetical protein
MGTPFNPPELYKSLTGKVTELVVLAIIGFGTTGVSALVKWVQDHTSSNRGAELTARISALSKTISELPDVPLSAASSGLTPRSVLTAQLESAVHELTALQDEAKAGSRFKGLSFAAAIARMRSAFLLYRPTGWGAKTLHLAFYLYMFAYIFSLSAVLDSGINTSRPPQKTDPAHAAQTSPAPALNIVEREKIPDAPPVVDTVANLFAFLFIFGLFAIPPVVLRHYAARIHDNQCEKAKAELKRAAAKRETPAGTTAQEAT